MPDTRRIIYWDSCVFLSYVNEMQGRMPVLDALLESTGGEGTVKLYTSMLTQVEVSFAASEQQERILDPQVEQRIESLWSDPEAVVSVEYHDGIGQVAKGLIRDAITRGWSLKPLDAIHLATAKWLSSEGLQVEEFHTYDDRLYKYGSVVGFSVVEPYTQEPQVALAQPYPLNSLPTFSSTVRPSVESRSHFRSSRRAILTVTLSRS